MVLNPSNGVDTLIVRLWVLRHYLSGGDWFLDVNLPGLKLESQGVGVGSFKNPHHLYNTVV